MEILKNLESDLKKKAALKSSSLFSLENAVVPDALVVQQASSDPTAAFVSSLIEPGGVVADLTGGLGVNSFYFSQKAKKVYSVEINEKRAAALRHNFALRGLGNIEVVNTDCKSWLSENTIFFDTVFIDPARRDTNGRRLVSIKDFSPDITGLIPLLSQRGDRLLVKLSPLLDISSLFNEFKSLGGVYILESQREVKELVLDFNFKNLSHTRFVSCVILDSSAPPHIMNFALEDLKKNSQAPLIQDIGEIDGNGYLYEPSPSLMKSGMYGALTEKFDEIFKLDANTHLFYSKHLFESFPGRIFSIERLIGSRDLKTLKGMNFNVVSKNHPVKAEELVQRFKLKSSDSDFIIACRILKDKVIIKASLITHSGIKNL